MTQVEAYLDWLFATGDVADAIQAEFEAGVAVQVAEEMMAVSLEDIAGYRAAHVKAAADVIAADERVFSAHFMLQLTAT
jgi:hypothetical protein